MATYTSILAWRIPTDRGAWWESMGSQSQLDMTERQSTHACTWIFMFTCDVYMWLPPIRSHHINCTKQGFLYGNHPVCVDHNKLWTVLQEMGIPDHLTCLLRNLYTRQEATVRTRHGTMDWFQIGKVYLRAVYCHPAYLTYMQSTSCEMPG